MNRPHLLLIGIIVLLALALLSAGCVTNPPPVPDKTVPPPGTPPSANASWSFWNCDGETRDQVRSSTGRTGKGSKLTLW